MLTKILVALVIVFGALTALRVFGRVSTTKFDRAEQAAREKVRRELKGEDLVACPDCGSYVAKSEVCACHGERARGSNTQG